MRGQIITSVLMALFTYLLLRAVQRQESAAARGLRRHHRRPAAHRRHPRRRAAGGGGAPARHGHRRGRRHRASSPTRRSKTASSSRASTATCCACRPGRSPSRCWLGAKLMGIVGALLSLPVAAGVRMILEELRVELPGDGAVDPSGFASATSASRTSTPSWRPAPAREPLPASRSTSRTGSARSDAADAADAAARTTRTTALPRPRFRSKETGPRDEPSPGSPMRSTDGPPPRKRLRSVRADTGHRRPRRRGRWPSCRPSDGTVWLHALSKPLATALLLAIVGRPETRLAWWVDAGIGLSIVGDVALLGSGSGAFLVGLGGVLAGACRLCGGVHRRGGLVAARRARGRRDGRRHGVVAAGDLERGRPACARRRSPTAS